MKLAKGRNRAREFENLVKGPRDLDPEEEAPLGSGDDSLEDDEDAEDVFDGREHYESVGKSKLRTAPVVALGPQYRGSKVSRDAVGDEEDDDPFDKGFDVESSEDDDEEMEAGANDDDDIGEEEDEDKDESASDLGLADEDEDGTSQTDLSDDEALSAKSRPEESVKAALEKGIDREAQRAVAASISQANKEDAEKGRAVKQQQATFDTLLGMRMKLQKSLVATNTIVALPQDQINSEREDVDQALEAAEKAAFTLWSSLNDFREDLLATKTGQKRKRSKFTLETPTHELWNAMRAQESLSKPERDNVLRKWSHKSQGVVVQTDRTRLNHTDTRATITDILQEHLSSTDRLLKRAYTPRSCAPLQLAQRTAEDPHIYDDADFYSLLLQELLEQKSQDSSAAAAPSIDLGFQMRREAKTKKIVDTKASKGRKLRYTVHEKLQNYMAPEDRCTWGTRQVDELFGSLFGQKLGLGEREDDLDDEMQNGISPEEAGLMLFRS